MSKIIENLKSEFKKDFYFDKEYITYEEYQKLLGEQGNNVGTETENYETKYFKKIYYDFTSEELQEYCSIKSIDQNNRILNNLRMLNEKLDTMKGIMIFWFILTIINIGCVIYVASKIASVFKNI